MKKEEGLQKELHALDGDYNGKMAKTDYGQEYTVKGWYMDSNGCLKTYSSGYEESFICDTVYN